MLLYKMSSIQYDSFGIGHKRKVTHQDIIDECNNRLSLPNIPMQKVHLTHNNKTQFVCVTSPIRGISNVVIDEQ